MPEQDSLKTIIHVFKHLGLHALVIASEFAFMFSNLHVMKYCLHIRKIYHQYKNLVIKVL